LLAIGRRQDVTAIFDFCGFLTERSQNTALSDSRNPQETRQYHGGCDVKRLKKGKPKRGSIRGAYNL
jgi:hypothetical protein